MTRNERQKYTEILLAFGAILILAALLQHLLIENYNSFFNAVLLTTGLLLMVAAALRRWWFDKRAVDIERTKKSDEYGMARSWQLTLLLLLALYWMDLLGYLNLRIKDIILGVIIVILYSYLIFRRMPRQ